MLGLYFNGLGVKVSGVIDVEKIGCCFEGLGAFASLEHAVVLQGQPGFEDITDGVIGYREKRCGVADDCDIALSGLCALKEAGMLSSYPGQEEYQLID